MRKPVISLVDSVEELSGFGGAVRLVERIAETLQEPRAMRMREDEPEDMLAREGNEVLRQLMQAHLDARQGGPVAEGHVEGADGVTRGTVRGLPRNLETRFGTVVVNRQGYAAPGAASLVPMDASLNLPERKYSFSVQRTVAEEAAKGSFDNVVEMVERRVCPGW